MDRQIKLSDGEKVILLMLCEIQEHLEVKGETDTGLVKEAICSGNLWAWIGVCREYFMAPKFQTR